MFYSFEKFHIMGFYSKCSKWILMVLRFQRLFPHNKLWKINVMEGLY